MNADYLELILLSPGFILLGFIIGRFVFQFFRPEPLQLEPKRTEVITLIRRRK